MKSILYIVALILPGLALAQNDLKLKGHLIDGVDKFKSQEYDGASMSFASGESLKDYEDIATYNRALSLLASENLEDANTAFSNALENTESPMIKSRSWYNKGNLALMSEQPDPETAIDAYKSALRIDPGYQEARHNLAVAYKLLQQQQEQEQQEQQQEQQQDQNQEEQDQDQEDQENQDQQDQQEQEQEQKDDGNDEKQGNEEEKQEQQVEKQLSKEEMARILENLENEEEKIQEKLMKAKSKGSKRKIEKEW
jgi:type IV secretory pathway VirB10-like protein